MALAAYTPKSRVPKDRVMLTNVGFSRWLSKRKGVSSAALTSAMTLLIQGTKEAMAEGYGVRWIGLGTFEMRELPARNRYHRKEKRCYLSPPSVVAHFKKSDLLTHNIRKMSEARLAEMRTTPRVAPAVTK